MEGKGTRYFINGQEYPDRLSWQREIFRLALGGNALTPFQRKWIRHFLRKTRGQ